VSGAGIGSESNRPGQAGSVRSLTRSSSQGGSPETRTITFVELSRMISSGVTSGRPGKYSPILVDAPPGPPMPALEQDEPPISNASASVPRSNVHDFALRLAL
jgi:hypothetical protein